MEITQSAIDEIKSKKKLLKITVEVGGCQGFQYELSYKNEASEDDVRLNDFVLTDQYSFNLIKNIKLDYIQELGYEEFVIQNPDAKKGCGCGNSFS